MQTNKMNKEEPAAKETISLLAKNELAFSRLYRKFAATYSNHDFWLRLASDEKGHAQWLRVLQNSHDVLNVSKNFLSKTAIELMIQMVEGEISRTQNRSLIEALKLALKFEKSFAEKHFFEIFTPESVRANEVMNRLKAETDDHIRRIEDKLDELHRTNIQ